MRRIDWPEPNPESKAEKVFGIIFSGLLFIALSAILGIMFVTSCIGG